MASAEQLDVFGNKGSAASGPGHIVVEVKFIRGATHDALAAIPFPYFELHGRWNHPTTRSLSIDRCGEIVLALDRDELETERRPKLISLAPRVHQVKHTVVGPNAGTNL